MRTLFLAGDSTVQSYKPDQYPQTGWGQVFYKFFKGADGVRKYVRPDAPGMHCVDYEMGDFNIENHAFAARSSRSFIEQGRLDEIMKVAKPGDFLAVQFAHNDAYEAREERYVPVEKFGEWLKKYSDACKERGMQCFFVTPVTMRVFDENGECQIAFKEYRDAMIKAAKDLDVPCVDLSLLSTNYVNQIGAEAARDLYLWVAPGEYPESALKDGVTDNAHFQEYGATVMASLVARGIKELNDERLVYISDRISEDLSVNKPKRKLPEGFAWAEEGSMQEAAKQEILNRK